MKLLYTILLVSLSATASAQTPSMKKSPPLTEASPETVGMSKERLARIDTICQHAVSSGEIPGVVALVARKGKIVYYKAFGMADNEKNKPLKRDDIFRIFGRRRVFIAWLMSTG